MQWISVNTENQNWSSAENECRWSAQSQMEHLDHNPCPQGSGTVVEKPEMREGRSEAMSSGRTRPQPQWTHSSCTRLLKTYTRSSYFISTFGTRVFGEPLLLAEELLAVDGF